MIGEGLEKRSRVFLDGFRERAPSLHQNTVVGCTDRQVFEAGATKQAGARLKATAAIVVAVEVAT